MPLSSSEKVLLTMLDMEENQAPTSHLEGLLDTWKA